MTRQRIPLAVRLPADQVQWLDAQAEILGGRAAVIRLLLDDAITRGWTVRVGEQAGE